MDSEEISEALRRINEQIGNLSTIQRILLTTDGSVTSLLETIVGGPVAVRTLVQEIRRADRETAACLRIQEGEEVNYRVVTLGERASGKVLIYARSHTPLSRLDPVFRSDLVRADIPIGRIMKKHRIEARREINALEVLPSDEELSRIFGTFRREPLLSRRYQIIRHDHPLIAIQEIFPARYFPGEARVLVEAPSRIHLGLIEMSGSLSRVDGGIGIALTEPSVLLEVRRSPELVARGGDPVARARAVSVAEQVLAHLGVPWKAEITLHGTVRPHVGLGSGTSLALSMASALYRLAGKQYTIPALAALTGRGGTSGIGTAAFEHGGFVIDGGHSFGPGRAKEDFRPSAASRGVYPAKAIVSHRFPEEWKILLAIPEIPPGASGPEELDIFRSACPVPVGEVREICHEVLVRMLPGLVERDIELFGAAVNRLQELGFKKVELSRQAPVVRELMNAMREAGAACAGMSSFGPTVYAMADSGIDEIAGAARRAMGGRGEVILTRARNSGAAFRET